MFDAIRPEPRPQRLAQETTGGPRAAVYKASPGADVARPVSSASVPGRLRTRLSAPQIDTQSAVPPPCIPACMAGRGRRRRETRGGGGARASPRHEAARRARAATGEVPCGSSSSGSRRGGGWGDERHLRGPWPRACARTHVSAGRSEGRGGAPGEVRQRGLAPAVHAPARPGRVACPLPLGGRRQLGTRLLGSRQLSSRQIFGAPHTRSRSRG